VRLQDDTRKELGTVLTAIIETSTRYQQQNVLSF